MPPEKTLVHESRIKVPYQWSAGVVGTKFFKAIRDEKRILGTRCVKCAKVSIPPTKTCGLCFSVCADWAAVGPEGRVVSATQALYPSKAHAVDNPIFALIRLDGADTNLLHLLAGPLEKVPIGSRVRAVFKEPRSGGILDIDHFQLVPGTE